MISTTSCSRTCTRITRPELFGCLNLMNVNTVIMPDNAEDTSGDDVLDDIIAACEENGTKIVYITRDTEFHRRCDTPFGLRKLRRGSRDESGIMSTVSIGDYDMLVTGDVEEGR